MEEKIRMISAASEALSLKTKNPLIDNERVMQEVVNHIASEKSRRIKLGMIAAASYALSYKERNPSFSEKEIIKRVMNDLNVILVNIS